MNLGFGTASKASVDIVAATSVEAKSRVANVYEIDPLSDERWETFVKGHAGASVFHSRQWLRALQTAYQYRAVVLTSCPPETELTNGIVFCNIHSWLTGQRLTSLPFSDHCEPLVGCSSELDEVLVHLKKQVDLGRYRYIEIRPIRCQPHAAIGLGKSSVYRWHRLNLSGSAEELFRSFNKSCIQRKIRRAEREELRYEEGTSEALLQRFYELLVMTRRRQFLPPQPLSWFRALIAEFGDDLKIRTASKGEVAVASILTITHKKTMVYKYGCSDARFHKFGGVPFLFWHAIREAKDEGLEELDMGRSETSNLGLIAFKEHWGAAGTELSYWTYPQQSRLNAGGWDKGVLREAVPLLPNFVLKAMGKFLYGHVG